MDGYVFDGYIFVVKVFYKGFDVVEERCCEDKVKKVVGQRIKIIIKNLLF